MNRDSNPGATGAEEPFLGEGHALSAEPEASADAWTLSAASIVGRTVVTSDGEKIGEVVELRINGGSWKVSSLEVRLDRLMHRTLGVKRQLVHRTTMAIPTELVHSIKDTVILSVTTPDLRQRASVAADLH